MKHFQSRAFLPVAPPVAAQRLRVGPEGLDRARPVEQVDAWTIRVRTGMSMRSWGEDVTASVRPAEGGSTVEVHSGSRLRTTLFDYGQNRRNVERVLSAVEG
ncbi:DUF1499 domain-containing protein [Micromonospora mirobrigensis]|uniref:DUF1499 domain-containing protein n=1 Tax=Micromonospora mirobrigensis TaxID=262898 RepID=A0A1C4UEG7_9ACTN|nr:DUF1499 domain-containing protein [Micromonospora mirobrigensis]SCE70031.1 Protein of unknown function (DUF1499) [Micromonospora mirobrigensis]